MYNPQDTSEIRKNHSQSTSMIVFTQTHNTPGVRLNAPLHTEVVRLEAIDPDAESGPWRRHPDRFRLLPQRARIDGHLAPGAAQRPDPRMESWRHIRIQQMGKNASGQTHYLSVSGLERNGTVKEKLHQRLDRRHVGSRQFQLLPDGTEQHHLRLKHATGCIVLAKLKMSTFIQMITQGTVEVRILRLQQEKLAMANGLLTGAAKLATKGLTTDDLKMLFNPGPPAYAPKPLLTKFQVK
ncbi:hypothetical protein DAPPUDRAFT_323398 [Daphnia pulex]|uniref:Uncharacterized protein n=1 Tax=Daphnia pulex TaxID=6669 RepID=E9GYS3_DAPPU|nr:hypothetical protein DAPPUDRAFT_323398 [Daphnia pulex]|eukprot:EFX75212.1 hypothetical protein DAPPUDRAFT_323398 [Daphnia pulex]